MSARRIGSGARIGLVSIVILSTVTAGLVLLSPNASAATTTLTYYGPYYWAGYNGNSTIYVTNDTTEPAHGFGLPQLGSASWVQGESARYIPGFGEINNSISLNTSTSNTYRPSFYYYPFQNRFIFSIGLTAGSASLIQYPMGGPYYTVGAQRIGETIQLNLPNSDISTALFPSAGSGLNISRGNVQNSYYNPPPGSLAAGALAVGLGSAALATPPPFDLFVGGAAATASLIGLIASYNPPPSSGWATTIYPGNLAGSGTFYQVAQVSNGTDDTYYVWGSNAFGQLFDTETWIPGPSVIGNAAFTGGSVSFQAANQVGLYNNIDPFSDTAGWNTYFTGATTSSLTYQVKPAVALHGHVDGASGSALANVPVTLVETCGSSITTYIETTDSSGYWHFFANPVCTYSITAGLSQKGLQTTPNNVALNAALSGTNITIPTMTITWGEVSGKVVGNQGGLYNLPVSGASVKLASSVVSYTTTTNSNGQFLLDYSVAGTSSVPYTITATASGYSGSPASMSNLLWALDTTHSWNPSLGTLGSGGGCVAKGTPILTPDGYVQVQRLKPGDQVTEYDLGSGSLTLGTFLSANTTVVSHLISINHGWLLVTPTEQPVYIKNASFVGWLHDPQNLTTADSVFDPVNGSWIPVTSVQLISDHTTVYDVVTSGANNFIASGALLDKKI